MVRMNQRQPRKGQRRTEPVVRVEESEDAMTEPPAYSDRPESNVWWILGYTWDETHPPESLWTFRCEVYTVPCKAILSWWKSWSVSGHCSGLWRIRGQPENFSTRHDCFQRQAFSMQPSNTSHSLSLPRWNLPERSFSQCLLYKSSRVTRQGLSHHGWQIPSRVISLFAGLGSYTTTPGRNQFDVWTWDQSHLF
jgi:hypothetical protein